MMIETKLINNELNIELISYIDARQNILFKGKDIAQILGYSDADGAVRKLVSDHHKEKRLLRHPKLKTGCSQTICIDETGLYELIFYSNMPAAKRFREWVLSIVLPSIRKYGQYKLFDNPNNKMLIQYRK